MKYDIFETLKESSREITRLQEELTSGLRTLAEEIGQDRPLRHEAVETITGQMQTLEKLQKELIEKVGEDVSYQDAIRFGREDFGGFFTITSKDEYYRKAIEGLGAEFSARGDALFADRDAISLLRSIADAVRSQEMFETAKSELRAKLHGYTDGGWVILGLADRAYYFDDGTQASQSEDPAVVESPAASENHEVSENPEIVENPEVVESLAVAESAAEEPPAEDVPEAEPSEEPAAPSGEPSVSTAETVYVSEDGVVEGPEDAVCMPVDEDVAGSVFPIPGKEKQDEERFSAKKFMNDALWPQLIYVLELLSKRKIALTEDIERTWKALEKDASVTQEAVEDRLEKLFRRGFLYKLEHGGAVYWMIGRKAAEALEDERIKRELRAARIKAGISPNGEQVVFHPEWFARGVDPEKLLKKYYVSAEKEFAAAPETADAIEGAQAAPETAEIAEETQPEPEAVETVETPASTSEGIPMSEGDASKTIQEPEEALVEQPAEEPSEEPAEEPSEEPAEEPAEDAVASPHGGERAETAESDGRPEDEISADCKTLMETCVTPHEDPDAFMKVAERLLCRGRGIEAAHFLDTIVRGDPELKDPVPFVIVRDQIRQIAHIPGWEPETEESALLAIPDDSSDAVGMALFYGVQLSHLAGFVPHCRIDAAPPTKEDFDRIGICGSHDEYYDAVQMLQEIPRQEGGYSRTEIEAIVDAESRYAEFAAKAVDLSNEGYGGHFSELVRPIFKGEKMYSCLQIVASCKIDCVDEVEDVIKEIVELPSEWKELDEHMLQRGLDNYLDNTLWSKVVKINKIKIIKLEDPGRGKLLDYLEERTRFLCDWVCYIRSSRKLRNTKKFQRYADILRSLETLRDSISQGTPAAGALRFSVECLLAYLRNEKAAGAFDFILAGNEFFLGKDGLPEEMPVQPRLPAPWHCMLRQLSAPALSPLEALDAIESGEEGERMGNYRTAEMLAVHLKREFHRPYNLEDLRKRAEKEIANFDSETEKDCLYARIEDPEKEELNAARDLLKERYLNPKLPPEYGKLLNGLRDLRAARERIVAQQEARFREQIEVRYREKYAETKLFEEVERLIGEKNFAVAEEWLARLEEGETEPPSDEGFSAVPEVEQFLELDEEIHSFATSPAYKDQPFETWAMQKCKTLLGGGMTESEAKQYYHVWPWTGKQQSVPSREAVRSFLRGCGFEPGPPKGEETGEKKFPLFRFDVTRLAKTLGSYPHPIREFGTGMGELKVICCTKIPRSESIVEAVNGCKPCGSALIVLCKEPISRAMREEILRLSKENSRENPFLLIDPVLAFYLGLTPRDTRLKKLLRCTLPYTLYNPFGREPLAPEMFVPRDALLHLRKMDEPTPLVYGGRQLGKTALLRRACEMEDAEAEQSHAVYVSVQPSNGEDPKEVFIQKLSGALIEKGLIAERTYKDNQDICKAIKSKLNLRTKLKLRIYVDEMDDYFRMIVDDGATNLLVPFVDLRREYPDRFKFVFAGLHHVARRPRMLENNSVFGQLQQGMSIGPLKQYEARSLIQRPFSFLGIRIEPSAVELIAARANFYPGIIQEICKEIVQTIQSKIGEKPPYHVDEALLQKVCEAQRINQIICEKIMMTLTLDRSYEAIAKLFAHHHFEAPLKGYTPEELSAAAKDFADGNEDVKKLSELPLKELEILLDELVDMSILRPGREETSGARRFMLRKASFARQIGTEESLSNYLLGVEGN